MRLGSLGSPPHHSWPTNANKDLPRLEATFALLNLIVNLFYLRVKKVLKLSSGNHNYRFRKRKRASEVNSGACVPQWKSVQIGE